MIAQNPSRLVTLAAAASQLGLSIEGVLHLINAGELPWVFDLGLGNKTRELRIMRASLEGRAFSSNRTAIANLTLGFEHDEIAGTDLAVDWVCSRAHLKALQDQGEILGRIANHKRWLEIGSLRRFLRRRLVTAKRRTRIVYSALAALPHPRALPSLKVRHIATAANVSHFKKAPRKKPQRGGAR